MTRILDFWSSLKIASVLLVLALELIRAECKIADKFLGNESLKKG